MKSLVFLAIILLYGKAECQNVSTALTELGCTELLDALTSAGLIDDLDALGEVTLFAPTNEALLSAGELPTGDELISLLQYHATNVSLNSTQIENEGLVESLTGSEIRFNIYNDGQIVTAQGAQIDLNQVDTNVSNGKIHVINSVMSPPSGTILEYLNDNSATFSIALNVLEDINAIDILNGTDSYTVFVPTNAAFNAIPTADFNEMLDNTTYLSIIMLYHATMGTYYSAGLDNGDNITMLRGDTLTIAVSNDVIYLKEVDYSTVGPADASVTNGVLHVIDRVLDMPVLMMNASNALSPLISLALACLGLALSIKRY